jgi:2-polyprenyl-3-methyl-5-hydroxy-6-metoxy-1,4-benzoquinol methylase
MTPVSIDVATRAYQSHGVSDSAIYAMVVRALVEREITGGVWVDVGCGAGNLFDVVKPYCDRYIGIDAVHYKNFPNDAEFVQHDLDNHDIPLLDGIADVVCAVETIEHLENPRAFVRSLTRLAKPNGWVIVTTPNQLSLLSKLTLLFKNQFNAFQEGPGLYPTHITALLEIDLIRIFNECQLTKTKILYSNQSRIPYTSRHWQQFVKLGGQVFSDNILCLRWKSHH